MDRDKPIVMRQTDDGAKLLYHPDGHEYEVIAGSSSERFPATHVPIWGIDAADAATADEILDRLLPLTSSSAPSPLVLTPSTPVRDGDVTDKTEPPKDAGSVG